MKFYQSIILALISGCLIMFSIPGFDNHWMAWFALVPLLIALHEKTFIRAFFLGQIAAFPSIISAVYCIPFICVKLGASSSAGIFAVIFLTVYYSIYVGIFSVFYCFFTKNIKSRSIFFFLLWFAAVPSAWALLEYVHTKIIPGMPFTFISLGYSQWLVPEILQLASVAGVFGISFLIVLANLAIFYFFWKKKYLLPAIIGFIIIAIYISGVVRISKFNSIKSPQIKTTVLDAQIDPVKKWNKKYSDVLAKKYLALLKEAVDQKPDLIVWTETAIPWPISEGDDLLETALNVTYPARANHLVGIPGSVIGRTNIFYNSAFFIEPDGKIIAQHNKMELLLWVEKNTKSSKNSDGLSALDLSPRFVPGEKLLPLDTPIGKLGVIICNEILYPDLVRKNVENGAQLLVNMNNDIWFSEKIMPVRHYSVAVLRAVENNRDIIVASNGGISGFIDACGRTKTNSYIRKPKYLTGYVSSKNDLTFYTKSGIISQVLFALIIILSLFILFFKNN